MDNEKGPCIQLFKVLLLNSRHTDHGHFIRQRKRHGGSLVAGLVVDMRLPVVIVHLVVVQSKVRGDLGGDLV